MKPALLTPDQAEQQRRDRIARHLRYIAEAHGRYAAEGEDRGTFTLVPTQYHRDCEKKLNRYAKAYERGNEVLIAEYERRYPQVVDDAVSEEAVS